MIAIGASISSFVVGAAVGVAFSAGAFVALIWAINRFMP